jgi:hypothetical protein
MKILIEFLVADSPLRITVVNKTLEMALSSAECRHIVHNAND